MELLLYTSPSPSASQLAICVEGDGTESWSAAAQGNLPCFTYLLASFLLSLAKWPLGQLQTVPLPGSGLIYQRAVHVTAAGEEKSLPTFGRCSSDAD